MDKGQTKVPAKQMLADFFIKPLQGNLFRRFHEVIMGREHISTLKSFLSTTNQERFDKDVMERNVKREVFEHDGFVARDEAIAKKSRKPQERLQTRSHE